MGLIAVRQSDGREVESFSLAIATWEAMRKEPVGTYRMPHTGTPAVLKRSIRGLQFFAYRSGEVEGTTEPMSEAHAAAQIAIVRHLRSGGYDAGVERGGKTPSGERWQADVLCTSGTRLIAFEVQLAAQTLDDFERRNARYAQSDVECVWLVAPAKYMTFCKAIMARSGREDPEAFRRGRRPSLPNVTAVPFEIGNESKPDPATMRVAVFPKFAPPGPPARVTLERFVDGVLARELEFFDGQWVWTGGCACG